MLASWSSSSLAVVICASLAVVGCSSSSDAGPPSPPSDAGAPSVADASSALSNDGAAPPVTDAATAAPTCTEYCATVIHCNDAYQVEYPDVLTCMKVCAQFPLGTLGDTGNTVGCRLAHARAAAASPDTECAIAGPTGGGVCGSRCDAFCGLAAAACGDPFGGACASTCAGWAELDGGPLTEYQGNTLDCRETEVQSAYQDLPGDASDACGALGPGSTTCQ